MSEITWEQARAQYADGKRSKESLYPFWQAEVSALGGIDLSEHPQQGDPLFQHGWSPEIAAQHLRVVWMLKRWPMRQIGVAGATTAADTDGAR